MFSPGEIPADLQGSVFRNGPAKFERGGVRYKHVLDGDGLVTRFSIDGKSQKASFASRFVRTKYFEAEDAADAVLYRNTFGTQPEGVLRNVGNMRLKNVANTNVQMWGGKLYALWEAALPVELSPSSLEVLGVSTLEGELRDGLGGGGLGITVSTGSDELDALLGVNQAFTAHPRADGSRGSRMLGWGWAAHLDMSTLSTRLFEWDATSGELLSQRNATLSSPLAPHDFAATPRHYVFALNGMRLDLLPYVAGLKGPVDCLRTTGGAVTLQLVPRPGAEEDAEEDAEPMTLLTDDAYFVIHHATALEEADESGGRVMRLYTAGWPSVEEGPFLGDWGGEVPSYDDGQISPTHLFETSLRFGTKGEPPSVTKRTVAGGACIDHPHVDPRFEGDARCRYVYMSLCNEEGVSGSPPVGWMRWDRQSGHTQKWWAPEGCFCEEILVIPRGPRGAAGAAGDAGDAGDADTADAYLAGMLYDSNRGASCLALLDAAIVERGPLCKLWLSGKVPHGLHGCFVPTIYE